MKKIDIESVWINEAGFGVIKIGGFDQYLTKTQTAFFKLLTTKTGTTLEEFRHFYKILEIKELYKGQRKYEILHNGKFIRALTAEETE